MRYQYKEIVVRRVDEFRAIQHASATRRNEILEEIEDLDNQIILQQEQVDDVGTVLALLNVLIENRDDGIDPLLEADRDTCERESLQLQVFIDLAQESIDDLHEELEHLDNRLLRPLANPYPA